MRLWTVAHAVDDLYQGLVPSVVPYFVLDRHYGYVAASASSPTAGTPAGWRARGRGSRGSG
jgi:FSR family fosmidomycin resistance protein-like MFS transporter